MNKEEKKEYDKQYYIDNKEKIIKRCKKYYQEHKEECTPYDHQWYISNREAILKYKKEYKKKHKEIISKWQKKYEQGHKIKRNEYLRNKRKINLKFHLNGRISGAMYKSLKGSKNGNHWEDLVGYTLSDLIKRLKKTMPKGYDWNDFMQGGLHIDHIIPKSVFNYTKPEHIDFKRCWALNNLRLLPAKENLIKGSKLSRPFQPALKL